MSSEKEGAPSAENERLSWYTEISQYIDLLEVHAPERSRIVAARSAAESIRRALPNADFDTLELFLEELNALREIQFLTFPQKESSKSSGEDHIILASTLRDVEDVAEKGYYERFLAWVDGTIGRTLTEANGTINALEDVEREREERGGTMSSQELADIRQQISQQLIDFFEHTKLLARYVTRLTSMIARREGETPDEIRSLESTLSRIGILLRRRQDTDVRHVLAWALDCPEDTAYLLNGPDVRALRQAVHELEFFTEERWDNPTPQLPQDLLH